MLSAFGRARFDVFLTVGDPQTLPGATEERTEGIRRQSHGFGRFGRRCAVDVDEREGLLPGVGEGLERTAELIPLSHLGGVVTRFAVGEERQHIRLNGCGGTGRRSASVRVGAHGGHEIRLERLIGSTALSPRAPDFGEGLGAGILGATAITLEAPSDVKRGQLLPRIEFAEGRSSGSRIRSMTANAGTEDGVAELVVRLGKSESRVGMLVRWMPCLGDRICASKEQ